MRGLAVITAVFLLAGLSLGGAASLGRVLLAVGLPGWAAAVFEAPEWQGVARFRAKEYDAAAAAFAAAGQEYNQGNALAFAGEYAGALEAYDLAIASGDPRARANFDVVAAYYAGLAIDPEALALLPDRKRGPTAESEVGQGDARAASTGDGVSNTSAVLGMAELESRGKLGVRRVFKDYFMVADDRWLLQLEDVPGEFMTERILQEHKRRRKLGLSPPEPEDPR
jgi:Ca-activated chloride channel family protein